MNFFPLLLVIAGIVELLGPGSRQASRNQVAERADGTGHFLELAVFPSAGVNGFSKVQLWTSKRVAGKYSRIKLQEQELQIPDPSRIAKELYDFPYPAFASQNSAAAENRVAILCGTTDFTVRSLSVQALSVGPAIAVPAQARSISLRPGASEVWVTHAGSVNQISISDLNTARLVGTIPFRLNPQAVPVALLFSNSGRTAYAVVRNPESTADRGFVFLIDTATRQVRSQLSLGTTVPQSAVFGPDGATLYIAGTSLNDLNTAEPSLTYFDTYTNAFSVAAFGLPIVPDQLTIHPNGTRLYWLAPLAAAMDEFDVQSRRVIRRILLPRPIQVQNLEISPTGDILFIRDGGNQVALHLDAESGAILDTQNIPAGPGVALFRP